jgi:REP element-mobilizing transposase RayT
MSHIRIWVHCVWATKNRIPYLKDSIRDKVIFHILENSRQKGIYVDHINGYEEHLHALISLGGRQNISDLVQKIKGESSHWINDNKLTRVRFEWQDDFYCISVGVSEVDRVREYIRTQVSHHQKISGEEELEPSA